MKVPLNTVIFVRSYVKLTVSLRILRYNRVDKQALVALLDLADHEVHIVRVENTANLQITINASKDSYLYPPSS